MNLSIEELKELREAYANTRGVAEALDELIALKGEQVPVAWRMWPEDNYEEGFIVNHDEDPVKGPTATDAKGQRWVSSPLYDRPQKPIVLPPLASIHSNWSGEYLNKADVIAAIEAAGGIVKDGE